MDGQQNLEAIMGLIMYGGNAKSDAMEAATVVESRDFESADKKIVDTEESLVHTHCSQTGILAEEAKGNNMQVALLTVHSQDHLVAAIAFTDLAKEITNPYRRINSE